MWDTIWKIFERLADNDRYGVIAVVTVCFTFAAIALCYLVYKLIFLIIEKGIKLKLKDTELGVGNVVENKLQKSKTDIQQVAQTTNTQMFVLTVSQVVSAAVEAGYGNCRKRHELFEAQMSTVKMQLNGLQTRILSGLGVNSDPVKLGMNRSVLEYGIDKSLTSRLREILIADKLAKNSLDDLLDMHRNLIDSAHLMVIQAIDQLFVDTDKELIKAINSFSSEFKRVVSAILESVWESAKTYVVEMDAQDIALTEKVNKFVQSYLGLDSTSTLPKSWVESNLILPPTDLIGGDR